MAQIKKDTSLRKAILQAAITGQLISTVVEPVETTGGESLPLASRVSKRNSVVSDSERTTPSAGTPRNAPTETGKQLLDRIIEERNKKLLAEWEEALKKNPKAKKPVPIVASEIDEDEIPFEIPENWCWCRLGDVGDFVRGSGIKRDETRTEGYPCVRYGEMYTKYKTIITKTVSFVDKDIFDNCQKIKTNDIAMSLTGENEYDIALAAVYLGKDDVAMGGDMTRFRPCLINPLFYVYAINSPYGIECKSQLATGNIIVHISNDKLSSILFPLPPLSVQNAIVAKLEQVLPLVDTYENAVLQKEELKSTLSDKVKKAILQEAITGKLTEQWRSRNKFGMTDNGHADADNCHAELVSASQESGEQLLARIIKERNAKALAEWEEKVKTNPKAKKPAPIVASEIEEDEIPFEVPESWCWCRLGNLVPFGQCENAEPNEIEDVAWILDLEDIEKDTGRILQFKNKKEVDSKSTKHVFKKGYVLYSKLRPYLNKCVIAPKDGYCTSEILPLDFGNLINNKFAQIFLMSPYFVDYTDSLSFGVKMPRLGTEDGKKALVPLPPLEEQEEIVKKVEELLTLCK